MTGHAAPSTQTATPVSTLIGSLADNKYFLGRRYAEWCTAAPTLESAVAAAAMAQDEIGHARSLYPLLKDLLGQSPEVDPVTRTSFTHADFLKSAFTSWGDFVAANFLFDTALTVLLESARESSLMALSHRANRILEEEPLHWLHGEGWTRRLGRQGGAVRNHLSASFAIVLPESLAWFDVATGELVAQGVVRHVGDELRSSYRRCIDPILEESGLPAFS